MHKAIYFDLDNTLVNRNKSISAYSEIFADRYSEVLEGVIQEDIARVIVSQDNGGYLSESSPYKTVIPPFSTGAISRNC